MASHIMQHCYVSLSGDKFHFGYFVTKTASAVVHERQFYNAVSSWQKVCFRIFFRLFDEASPKRRFYISRLHRKMAEQFLIMNKPTKKNLTSHHGSFRENTKVTF